MQNLPLDSEIAEHKIAEDMPKEVGETSYKDELVIGLVSPIGADLEAFEELISQQLLRHQYESNLIKLSGVFDTEYGNKISGIKIDRADVVSKYTTKMDAGDRIRKNTGQNDFLAQYAILKIGNLRTKDGVDTKTPKPLKGIAHILHSLKHKEEVETLRGIYGDGFFLVGIYCHEEQKKQHLISAGATELKATELIIRDYYDNQKFGQQYSKAYELSDVFIHLDLDDLEKTKGQIRRFLELVFGSPFQTPTRDENAMFLAYASSLRSGSLARQVGAAITSKSGDVIATGTNDTPRYGGGQYWTDSCEPDHRDFARGFDSNTLQRNNILLEVMKAFVNKGFPVEKKDEEFLLSESKNILKRTSLFSLTEFGRDVHAEMEALLCCARIGVSPKGGTLYTTTFPCHNCAKHIVVAGIDRVVYVEPYPKSKAKELHSDSIEIDHSHKVKGKIRFEPFIGIGPRKYFDLFSLSLSTGRPLERKDDDGKKTLWQKNESYPRIQMPPTSYIEREQRFIEGWGRTVQRFIIEEKGKTNDQENDAG